MKTRAITCILVICALCILTTVSVIIISGGKGIGAGEKKNKETLVENHISDTVEDDTETMGAYAPYENGTYESGANHEIMETEEAAIPQRDTEIIETDGGSSCQHDTEFIETEAASIAQPDTEAMETFDSKTEESRIIPNVREEWQKDATASEMLDNPENDSISSPKSSVTQEMEEESVSEFENTEIASQEFFYESTETKDEDEREAEIWENSFYNENETPIF